MRWISALLVTLCVVTGCQSKESSGDKKKPVAKAASSSTKGGGLGPAQVTSPSTNQPSAGPVVLPASGRVHSVNTGLRFVVIDYTLGGMPALNSILPVYRNNEKVGQIKLSGPERNGFAAGDIMEGFIQIDDEVRIN